MASYIAGAGTMAGAAAVPASPTSQRNQHQHRTTHSGGGASSSASRSPSGSTRAQPLSPLSRGEEASRQRKSTPSEASAQRQQGRPQGSAATESEAASALLTPETAAEEVYPLHYAAATGDRRLLQALLDDGPRELQRRNSSARRRTDPRAFSADAPDGLGRTPLVYAVVRDSMPCAELLLLRNCNANAPDNEGRTALHWACFHGKTKMIKLLLANGANPLLVDNDNRGVLHLCAHHGTAKTLQLLLRAQEQQGRVLVELEDGWGMRPLHWAAHHANTDQVKLLLKQYHACVFVADKENKTPLHWAASSGNVECLKTILQHWKSPANRNPQEAHIEEAELVNHLDNEGRTVLHLAMAGTDDRIIKTLLNIRGILATKQDNLGRTPLHWAAFLNRGNAAQQLFQHSGTQQAVIVDANGQSPLQYAALQGNVGPVSAILKPPDIYDVPDTYGSTALMTAAMAGHVDVVARLLGSGKSNVRARDQSGSTALHVAAYYGHASCVELILRAGAEANALDGHGQTPLFHACGGGHADVAQALFQAGGSVHFVDGEGRSLLHWAAVGGHDQVCTMLLSRNLPVDGADNSGRTPLHNAAFGNHGRTLAVLLQAGANADLQDDAGITALHWAASTGSLDVVELLLHANAYVNVTEYHEERLTPLDYAEIAEHVEVAQLLRDSNALTAGEVRGLASAHLQAWWRGHRTRVTLLDEFRTYLQNPGRYSFAKRLAEARRAAAAKAANRPVENTPIMPAPYISRKPKDLAATAVQREPLPLSSPKPTAASPPRSQPAVVSPPKPKEKKKVVPLPELTPKPGQMANPKRRGKGRKTRRRPDEKLSEEETQREEAEAEAEAAAAAALLAQMQAEAEAEAQRMVDLPSLLSPMALRARQMAKQERERVRDIRRKVGAATRIQRAYRRWALAKLSPEYEAQRARRMRAARTVDRSGEGASRIHLNPSDKRQQIAALTIQLAWRRYLSEQGTSGAKRRKRGAGRNYARARPRRGGPAPAQPLQLGRNQDDVARNLRNQIRMEQQRQAYARKPPAVTVWRPKPNAAARPAHFHAMPSPAITSFNMALTTYAEPFLELQAERLMRAERILKEHSMRKAAENRGKLRQQPSKRRDINVDDVVRSPPEQVSNSPRNHSRSPRKAAGRVDPHEILRRHQEKRRQEELLDEAASMNTATSQHYQQQASMQAQQSQTPTTNTYRLAPISASPNGEVIMDGRARQAALARYRKSQLKPITRTGGVTVSEV